MNRLTSWIVFRFGKPGLYIYSALIGIINLLPMLILDFPTWLYFLVFAALWFVPILQLPYLGIWIWAFVVCLGRPITWLSIVFMVAFVLYFGNIVLSLVKRPPED